MTPRRASPWLLLSLGLTSCQPVLPRGGPIDSARLTDGVFQGSAAHIDRARVSITVQHHRVVNVALDAFEASPVGQKARDRIPLRIVERQSTKVDVVSGATEASNVIMNAVEDAVRRSYESQAKAP